MENYMMIVRSVMLFVTMISIFTILFVTLLMVIRKAAFFKGKTAILMAVSLSLLFLVALSQFLMVPKPESVNHTNTVMGYLYLVPGVGLTLAAAVVLSQILLLASKTSASEKADLLAKNTVDKAMKAKSSGKVRKNKMKQSPGLQKSVGKAKNEAKVNPDLKEKATT